jgi:radical SAM superfamily enzyme YgiQ (UPF0313 family)
MAIRRVVLVQLPIPPLGPAPIRGNVPLAAAYLKLYADARGLSADYAIEVFPAALANTLGDHALVEALASREPWMVGFTCYLWNVERTLWIARELKRRCPCVKIVLGGPEITADNAWVLGSPDYDFAAVGEGEQTFAALLLGLLGKRAIPARTRTGVSSTDAEPRPARLTVFGRHPERGRRAHAPARNDPRLRLQVQVLLLPQELRPAVLPLVRFRTGEPRARL